MGCDLIDMLWLWECFLFALSIICNEEDVWHFRHWLSLHFQVKGKGELFIVVNMVHLSIKSVDSVKREVFMISVSCTVPSE